jgi:hypothetical protein
MNKPEKAEDMSSVVDKKNHCQLVEIELLETVPWE